MKIIVLLLSILLFTANAEAYKYYYTGITGTSPVAHVNSAEITMYNYPQFNCATSSSCFAVGWVLLWNTTVGQYAEAGIGYQPGKCHKSTPVKLWYATVQSPGGVTVGCVPLGTPVRVSILKDDGKTSAFILWEYGNTKISRNVSLPGWLNGSGIHPVKVEVYTSSNITTPYPVKIRIKGFMFSPYEMGIKPQETFPYLIQPGSVFEDFTVAR